MVEGQPTSPYDSNNLVKMANCCKFSLVTCPQNPIDALSMPACPLCVPCTLSFPRKTLILGESLMALAQEGTTFTLYMYISLPVPCVWVYICEVNSLGCWHYKLTIDVIGQQVLKHGARLAGFHINNHLFILFVLVHAHQGLVQLLGRQQLDGYRWREGI